MSAIISPCGKYRYRLDRTVQMEGLVFAFFGVNPSTADAVLNDQTLLKWIGFAKRNGCRRFIVGNPFAYRATDVRELGNVQDPFGPDNLHHLKSMVEQADVLVPFWGNEKKVPERLRYAGFTRLRQLIFDAKKPVKTFGLTKESHPKHPLMLGYDTSLIDFPGFTQSTGEHDASLSQFR